MVSSLYGPLSPPSSQSSRQSNAFNETPALRGQADSSAKAAESAGKSQRQVIRTQEDAINLLRSRLQQQVEQSLGKLEAPGAAARSFGGGFQPPSAADVAGTILNFVQLRLEQEAAAGADPERLANLMEQARSGIEKGYGEAREQIQALGLMNPTLADEIDDGFNRIQSGLDQLTERFLGQLPAAGGGAAPVRSGGTQVESASRGAFQFEVTTADGDKVSVSIEESRYSAVQNRSATDAGGESSALAAVSAFAGRYSFSVEGDLDSDEREAIAGLLEQAQGVAGQFFRGDVQGAFESAQGLALGGEELASFSLNLSSSRTVSASAYESTSGQPSLASQLRPLAGLAQGVRDLGQSGPGAGLDLPTLNGLVQRMLNDQQAAASESVNSNRPMMDDFIGTILNGLQADQAAAKSLDSL